MTDPTLFAVPQPLLEKVLSYLVQRPYHEVVAMIADLTQCQPVAPEPHEPSNP